MSFSASYLLNDKLDVQNKNVLGTEQIKARHEGVLPAGTTKTVINTSNACVIDSLVFAANSEEDFMLSIYDRYYERNLPFIDLSNWRSSQEFTPLRLTMWGNAYFNVLEYNRDRRQYNFSLKQPLYFPGGLKINVRNRKTGESINAVVDVYGRVFPRD